MDLIAGSHQLSRNARRLQPKRGRRLGVVRQEERGDLVGSGDLHTVQRLLRHADIRPLRYLHPLPEQLRRKCG